MFGSGLPWGLWSKTVHYKSSDKLQATSGKEKHVAVLA
jgi:hypothetical protein|tara:strand:+ start:6576 stop:6689 length:114 start_codon:yes stop_codon:yes gene_type:complete